MLSEKFLRPKDIHDRDFTWRRRGRDLARWERAHGFRDEPTKTLEPYTLEDELLDQLGRLPSPEFVELLVAQLRNPELKEFAAGVINDISAASKKADSLAVIKAINDWIATAEEPISSRRRIRHVLAAREKARGQKPAI